MEVPRALMAVLHHLLPLRARGAVLRHREPHLLALMAVLHPRQPHRGYRVVSRHRELPLTLMEVFLLACKA